MTGEDELQRLARVVAPPSEAAAAEARRAMDAKTKPRGSLGRIEELAVRVAAARGTLAPPARPPLVVVAAADHGVADEGVSAYPQEVTAQMVRNFAGGGAAVCVLSRLAGAELHVVDAGIVKPVGDPAVRLCRIGPGTANTAAGPAMTRADAIAAVLAGATLAREIGVASAGVVAVGEMGIANTTSAAAVVAAVTGSAAAAVCGPGTGLDADGVRRKAAVVERMLAVNAPDPGDPVGVLAAVGGFEIGLLTGLAVAAAAERAVVLLDGFITGAAALLAARLAPAVQGYLVASHRSPEPGHAVVLRELDLEPLLELGLRLGEGSGAALALPLLRAAWTLLDEMATFESAAVTDTGR